MTARGAPLLLGALFLILVSISWIGFIASDDVTYARGAYGWIEQFPYVGGHGTIRYPLTIPMALSFAAFGGNEYAMVLPSLLYMFALLALAWSMTRAAAGEGAAAFALAAFVTSPLLVIQASIANVDAVECAFLLASFALFWRASEAGASRRLLLSSGACAGLAFLTRETAIFAAIFYAPLFLIGYRMRRLDYLWIVAGFAAVWAIELVYLGIMTGDPRYRFNISLNHDATIDRGVDLAGNMVAHPLVDPLLVLLANQEFMLLFWLTIPAWVWLCTSRRLDDRTRRYARLIAWMGASWFLCAAAAQTLLPLNPRYFMLPAVAACIVIGLALSRCQLRIAAVLLVILVGANILGIAVENKASVFGERVAARIVAAAPGTTFVTDAKTRYRAELLLRWDGTQSRLVGRAPQPGDRYLFNPARATDVRPLPNWREVARYSPRPTPLAHLVISSGLDTVLPSAIVRKLTVQHPPVSEYIVR